MGSVIWIKMYFSFAVFVFFNSCSDIHEFLSKLLEDTLESYVRGSGVDITAYCSAFAYRIFFIFVLALAIGLIAGKVVQKFRWIAIALVGLLLRGNAFFVMSDFKNSMLSSCISQCMPIVDRCIIIFGCIEDIILRAVGLTFAKQSYKLPISL